MNGIEVYQVATINNNENQSSIQAKVQSMADPSVKETLVNKLLQDFGSDQETIDKMAGADLELYVADKINMGVSGFGQVAAYLNSDSKDNHHMAFRSDQLNAKNITHEFTHLEDALDKDGLNGNMANQKKKHH